MSQRYILAIDQGTSATKTVIFDAKGQIAAKAACPLKSCFPRTGFVEQEPEDIYQSVIDSVRQCLQNFKAQTGKPADIAACGISNQRETFLLWDKTGKPLSRAVVWQCKRSVDICTRLKNTELAVQVNKRTGLIVDPYFSGTKLLWLCENDPQIKNAIDDGNACFGTVDTWLLYRLSGGKSYCTDYTNASRTLFFNIDQLKWDAYLLEQFGFSSLNLPTTLPSSHLFGQSDFQGLFAQPVKITAMIGDSHAAAFGEGCFTAGTAKATMGTGCSILLNTGSKRVASNRGMVTTICWSMDNRVDYAMEGVIVTCGAAISWLKNQLGLIAESAQTEAMALAVENSNGVCLVPAFSGIGTPHWRMDIKAAIMGLTFGCSKNHLVRAALESMAFQIKDVIDAMAGQSGVGLEALKVDGGISANRFVMQFLADLLNIKLAGNGIEEVSALGAAYLAGLYAGIWGNLADLDKVHQNKKIFSPGQGRVQANETYRQYQGYLRMLLHT